MAVAGEDGTQGGETTSIDDFRVPETGVFILGCLESRVTVLSQQRRALNLVDALLADWFVGDEGRVAVVGAGAAGVTAAVALATAGAGLTIDLFDRKSDIMHFQHLSERDLHPRIYDWPLPGSTDPQAGLPILDWRAGPAKDVANEITKGFKAAVHAADGRLAFRRDSTVTEIRSIDDGISRVEVEGQRDSEAYDAVILAVGFGYERKAKGQPFSSYWAPVPVQGPLPPNPVLLVSGNGDGGLVDFAAAALRDMSHKDMIDLVARHPSVNEIIEPLLEIEGRAWGYEEAASIDILSEYRKLRLPRPLLGAVHSRLRKHSTVWLHTREPQLFRRTTAIINRFTAFLIIETDERYNKDNRQIQYVCGSDCVQSSDEFRIGAFQVAASIMVPRFGPDKVANFQPFKSLIDAFDKRRRLPRDNRFRPAMPELSGGALRRFGHPPTATVVSGGATSASSATQASGPVESTASADARRWLEAKGIPFELASLERCIRSSLAEPVAKLLQAGIPVDIQVAGQPPLELALSLLDDGPSAQAQAAVVKAIVFEGPRGVAAAAHKALIEGSHLRLAVLLGAGVGLDARDAQGTSLAARAMRADGETEDDAWVGLLAQEAQPPLAPIEAAWLLLWAAFKNRVALLRVLLDKGVPVDVRLDGTAPSEPVQEDDRSIWWTGGTALHLVLSPAEGTYSFLYAEPDRYSMEALRLLIDRGASSTAVDAMGRTPLHVAARCGLAEAAALLLAAPGSDLTLRDGHGQTPLDCAMSVRRSESIALEIARSALPAAPVDRARLLHRAAANRDLPMLELLLDMGCDPNAACDDSPSAIMTLARDQDELTRRAPSTSCLSLLLSRGGDPLVRDERRRTALHWLASGQESDVVEFLLSLGVDPDATDEDGRTALMNARAPEVCRMLLEAGATPSRCDVFGYDAADHAWLGGRSEVVALLQGPEGAPRPQARLVLAIRAGDVAEVEAALDAGAEPQTRDPVGRPVLNLAADIASATVVRLLLERGADVLGREAGGRNALDCCLTTWEATAAEIAACATELIDRGSSLNVVEAADGTHIAAVFRGHMWWQERALADRLLEACGDALGRDGENALMVAAERGTARQVAARLAVRFDPTAADRNGRTALHYAARGRGDTGDATFAEKADVLWRARANIDAAADDGSTALFEAVTWTNWDAVRWLLDKNADPQLRDSAGLTPQMIAIRIREPGLANLLLGAAGGRHANPRSSSPHRLHS